MRGEYVHLFRVGLLAISSIGAVHAGERIECATPVVHSAVMNNSGEHTLRITVQNPTAEELELVEFRFQPNMLRISATRKDDGRPLGISIPFITPGVGEMRLRPGETTTREVFLDSEIHDLATTLLTTDVDVSWTLVIEPTDGCFREEMSSTVTLTKTAN